MGSMQSELQKAVVTSVTEDETAKRGRTHGDLEVVKRLVTLCGNNQTQAAELIGYTPQGLSDMLLRGTCPKTAEVAARGVIAEMHTAKPERYVYLVQVSSEKRDALVAVCNALDVPLNRIKV